MAVEGLKPFCAIYSTFMQRGYDQVIHDAVLQKLPVNSSKSTQTSPAPGVAGFGFLGDSPREVKVPESLNFAFQPPNSDTPLLGEKCQALKPWAPGTEYPQIPAASNRTN